MMSTQLSKKKRILVIDPDEEFCRSIRLYLEEDYQVTTRQGFDYFDYSIILNKIDLLIMEADLADARLIHLIKQIRHNHPAIRIIIMYVYFPPDKTIEKALVEDADDIISKPFDVDILQQKVNSLLS
jgi:DNA-binding NtrC family response regulator